MKQYCEIDHNSVERERDIDMNMIHVKTFNYILING